MIQIIYRVSSDDYYSQSEENRIFNLFRFSTYIITFISFEVFC